MRRRDTLRLLLLMALPLLLLSGLLAASVATPGPKKKPPSFPLILFQQATPDDYIDDRACARCHAASAASMANSPHAPYMQDPHLALGFQGCQACHGPGGPHVAHRAEADHPYQYVISYTRARPMEIAQVCLRCHNDTLTMDHWRRTGHARAKVTCTDCHQIHWQDRLAVPKSPSGTQGVKDPAGIMDQAGKSALTPIFSAQPDPKALLKADEATLCGRCHQAAVNEFRQNFHHPVPEGRLVCSDCHDPHPSKDLRKRFHTFKQSCVTCHPQIAGPFVYEHDPVSDLTGNGCLECHRPHGSPNPNLLSAFSRGLCLQCHSDKVTHFPGRTCWQAGCHASPHGSNHDVLFFRP